ncbi:MAG: hypothetical protein P1U56_23160 [Saprospiraceae bacterium]|nr:hypothetical protein [Saprospiraceae bacterium]
MKNYNILIIVFTVFVLSCGENVTEEPNENLYGYGYFPIEVGYTWEYQVDSVLILQGGNSNKATTSYIQEEVTELLSENEGEKTYKLIRSYRKDLDSDWLVQKVWQISKDETSATRTEGNIRFIKMVFPNSVGTKWDGNSFFDANQDFLVGADNIPIFQDWSYKIEDKGIERTINDTEYGDVLHVSHIDEESLIGFRFSEEYYIQGIGLAERNMQIFESQDGDTLKPWLERAEVGFQLNQTLLSFSAN